MLRILGIVLVIAIASWALSMVFLSLRARRPNTLGVQAGRLAPCPNSPNCVSSQASDEAHAIEPLHFRGDPDEAWERLQDVLAGQPRTKIISVTEEYLHAECTSRLFRFVDDLECVLDRNAQLIHVRSASRVGHSDLGVNRQRVEALRKAFTASRSAGAKGS
jgi:uncharacterized protein (DUF1499 family)